MSIGWALMISDMQTKTGAYSPPGRYQPSAGLSYIASRLEALGEMATSIEESRAAERKDEAARLKARLAELEAQDAEMAPAVEAVQET